MSGRVMKAIRCSEFGGLDVLKYVTDAPVPVPKSNEVLIRVHAAGVNPVDTYVRQGTYEDLPTLPFIPGKDVSGVVEEVGDAVTKFKKGDKVYTVATPGGYAQYTPADEGSTFPLTDKLNYNQGAAVGIPYFTAYMSLHTRGEAKPGETVLVHGASGACGLASCQLARSYGCKVIGTAGTPEGLKLVEQNGAHFTVNHKEKDYLSKIKEYTEGRGVDVILEMLANVNLQNDLHLLAKFGRVIIVGSRGPIEINPRLTMGKGSDIRGLLLYNADMDEFSRIGAYLTAGFEQGWLNPIVGEVYPLQEARKAQEEVITHSSGSKGKIVLSIDQE